MKSSESSTKESEIKKNNFELPENVTIELINTIDQINSLLKDNPDFAKQLILKCLLIEKKLEHHVYINDIQKMILAEYPDALLIQDGKTLFKTIGSFVEQLCLKSEILHAIIVNMQVSQWGEVRDQIDMVVLNHMDINPQEIDLVGGLYIYE